MGDEGQKQLADSSDRAGDTNMEEGNAGGEEGGQKGDKLSERYYEQDADVTIISSDGVIFKVHSHYLKSTSPIFRTLLGMAMDPAQRDAIKFTDAVLEHSVVVSALLDTIIDHELPFRNDGKLGILLVDLAKKWEFPMVFKIVANHVRCCLLNPRGHDPTTYHLGWASRMGDFELIGEIIQHTGDWVWEGVPNNRFKALTSDSIDGLDARLLYDDPGLLATLDEGSDLEDRTLFVPGSMSLHAYLRVPPLIHWAIARAILLIGDKKNHPAIGEQVTELLRKAFPPSSKSSARGNDESLNPNKRARLAHN